MTISLLSFSLTESALFSEISPIRWKCPLRTIKPSPIILAVVVVRIAIMTFSSIVNFSGFISFQEQSVYVRKMIKSTHSKYQEITLRDHFSKRRRARVFSNMRCRRMSSQTKSIVSLFSISCLSTRGLTVSSRSNSRVNARMYSGSQKNSLIHLRAWYPRRLQSNDFESWGLSSNGSCRLGVFPELVVDVDMLSQRYI